MKVSFASEPNLVSSVGSKDPGQKDPYWSLTREVSDTMTQELSHLLLPLTDKENEYSKV